MMNRRTAISAALCIGARLATGQERFGIFNGSPSLIEPTVLEFRIEGENIKTFEMHYKGRTATVSMDEVMDSLGAVPDKP